ncbi:MAG: efflux RND transporter permease subunit [Prevotella sp.]
MLNKIIRFSLDNRLFVLIAGVLLMIGGLHTARNIEVDVFPDLNAPTVVVMTEAKGMAAEEVERLVTFPIETAVNGATDVRRVRSSSTNGFSVVWVEFNWGADVYRARQIVTEKLATINGSLPKGIGSPTLGPQSSILGELMFVALTSDSTSLQELRTLADWTVRPRLMSTGGVAQVAVLGGDIREYQIQLSPERMKHYGVGLDEAIAAVGDMNRNVAAGTLYEYGNEYIIRGLLSTADTQELGEAVVKRNPDGMPICLNAIANVTVGNRVPRMGTASYNGKPAVMMTVTKQPAVSTLELTELIDSTLVGVKKSLPSDVKLTTDIYRQSRFIDSSISNVKNALIEGGVLVVVVLFLFLMNVRTTIISLVTIPLSLLAAIVALHAMGLTINTMSLGGMCIAIGSLVDDAIVDVENVYKRLRENRLLPEGERESTIDVIFEASKEVRLPILNSTLIIIASFMPIFFLSGMEGRMLQPLGIAFIVALYSSTVVALTLTPVMCSYLLGKGKMKDGSGREPYVARKMKEAYLVALGWALSHKRTIVASTGAALIAAIALFMTFGSSFLPPFNEGSMTINVSTLPGISLDESDKIGRRAEELLLTIPEIKTVGRKTGRAELDEHALGVNTSEIEAPYELKDRTKDQLLDDIRHKLSELPGVNIEVGSPISHRIDAMLSGTRASIAIKVFGSDLNQMFKIGNEIKNGIGGIEGIADLNVEQQVERPQLTIRPRRTILAKYGITMPQFAEMVEVLLEGREVSQVYEGNQTFALTLKVADDNRTSIDGIRHLMVDAGGRKVALENIAEVTSTAGPNTVNRENAQRKIVVSCNVAGRDLLGVVNDIQRVVDNDIDLPEGYHVEYGGQFESQQAASRTLTVASIVSLLVIFILLFSQFRNMTQSAVVMVNLPLALIGGVVAIGMTSGVVSIPSIIGFISLFGIATRNGMLLISRYNDLRSTGLSAKESVLRGSADRLNPILMTALTSALALIPMVLGGDLPGNEIQSPMAKVILGGLLTSTLLNGFVIPVMYMLIEEREGRYVQA